MAWREQHLTDSPPCSPLGNPVMDDDLDLEQEEILHGCFTIGDSIDPVSTLNLSLRLDSPPPLRKFLSLGDNCNDFEPEGDLPMLEKHADLLANFTSDEIWSICAARAMEAHERLGRTTPLGTGRTPPLLRMPSASPKSVSRHKSSGGGRTITAPVAAIPTRPGVVGASASMPSSPLAKRQLAKEKAPPKRRKSDPILDAQIAAGAVAAVAASALLSPQHLAAKQQLAARQQLMAGVPKPPSVAAPTAASPLLPPSAPPVHSSTSPSPLSAARVPAVKAAAHAVAAVKTTIAAPAPAMPANQAASPSSQLAAPPQVQSPFLVAASRLSPPAAPVAPVAAVAAIAAAPSAVPPQPRASTAVVLVSEAAAPDSATVMTATTTATSPTARTPTPTITVNTALATSDDAPMSSRVNRPQRCSLCGGLGHKSRTCTMAAGVPVAPAQAAALAVLPAAAPAVAAAVTASAAQAAAAAPAVAAVAAASAAQAAALAVLPAAAPAVAAPPPWPSSAMQASAATPPIFSMPALPPATSPPLSISPPPSGANFLVKATAVKAPVLATLQPRAASYP